MTPDDPEPPAGSESPIEGPFEVPIEDWLDLHPFAPRDVLSVVDEYLRAAADRGFEEVRVVHGRGIGAQRQAVQRLLAAHPLVAAFHDAPPERGGWGATIVRLKARSA